MPTDCFPYDVEKAKYSHTMVFGQDCEQAKPVSHVYGRERLFLQGAERVGEELRQKSAALETALSTLNEACSERDALRAELNGLQGEF